jgi:predicted transcriptional regulator
VPQTFGDLERSVMEVLWSAADGDGEVRTVKEVHAELERSRTIAYTTVMTVLDRLARKGTVEATKVGRANAYRARATRAEMTADLMHRTLADFTAGDRDRALVAFVDDASEADVAALRAALDRLGG